MTKYQTYTYEGNNIIIVGSSCVSLEPNDLFCIITQTQAKINSIIVNDVVFSEFLHTSKFVGDYTLAEYGSLVQEFLNKKHGLATSEPVDIPFMYSEFHDCLGSVVVTRQS